jgi:S-(hydroxymethyl)glutathione dehydrogenase/alcohol dehydrogenase
MRAAIAPASAQPMTVEVVEPAALGPRDVLVTVDATGVCHSDLTMLEGMYAGPYPAIFGHEGAGTVAETGAEVRSLRPGDRVIGSPTGACGACWHCVNHEGHLCTRGGEVAGRPRATLADGTAVHAGASLGSFANFMVGEETMFVKVDTDLPADQLALISCGVHTGTGAVFHTARVEPGASVAVLGLGGVGQAVVQAARIAGAARIFAIDPLPFKRARRSSRARPTSSIRRPATSSSRCASRPPAAVSTTPSRWSAAGRRPAPSPMSSMMR